VEKEHPASAFYEESGKYYLFFVILDFKEEFRG
jgi:hypothetical protein